MSVKNDNIKLFPPVPDGPDGMRETFTSAGHPCGYCRGAGFLRNEGLWGREREKKECPVCGGGGKLDAVVTIEWKPSNEHRE